GDWIKNRRKPLRDWLPYFTFMLSINIFFCLVLPTNLLKNVKQSHHIDLAYLYYLPFCSVFTSRDNFHVQVAPLFMSDGQEFVHGDDLKADLRKLDEYYSKLTEEVLDQGLCNFAQLPPDNDSFLTTRLWNKFLPTWRSEPKNKVDLDPQLQKVLTDMVNRTKDKSQLRYDGDEDIANMDYVTISRKVWTKKGKYLRFSKEVILKNQEEEMKKRNEVFPAGTQFSSLVDSLTDLFKDPGTSGVEVIFISFKLDEKGEKVVEDNQHVAQIRAVGVTGISHETQEVLREQYDMAPLISLMVLWIRPSAEKLGILKFQPIALGNPPPKTAEYEDWEKKAIGSYIHRNNLQ
ncbi:MAG: hypothetical protein ABSG62_04650, partial [Terracidiphilus sp.]